MRSQFGWKIVPTVQADRRVRQIELLQTDSQRGIEEEEDSQINDCIRIAFRWLRNCWSSSSSSSSGRVWATQRERIMSIMWPKQCKCLMEIIEHSKRSRDRESIPQQRPLQYFPFFCPIGVFCGNNLAGRLKLGCGFGGREVGRKLKLKRVHNEIKLIEISRRNATNCVSMSFNELWWAFATNLWFILD